jgi:heptosyltransferase-2
MIRALIRDPSTESCSVWGPPKVAVLFHHFPGIDRVFEFDSKTDPDRLDEIRNEEFQRVFLLPNSYSSASEAKSLNIPKRIGYRTQWRGSLLTHPIWCGPSTRNLRMAEYYLHLLPGPVRALSEGPIPNLTVSDPEREAIREKIAPLLERGSPLVGLSPGAAFGPAKQWFIPSFRDLARRLLGEGMGIAVLGGPDEVESGNRIVEGLPETSALNLSGKTTIREMMAALVHCRVLVTNDSGPMSTDSSWTGPRRDHHRILQSSVPCNPCFLRECPIGYECMKEITVDRVREEVCRILEPRGST